MRKFVQSVGDIPKERACSFLGPVCGWVGDRCEVIILDGYTLRGQNHKKSQALTACSCHMNSMSYQPWMLT